MSTKEQVKIILSNMKLTPLDEMNNVTNRSSGRCPCCVGRLKSIDDVYKYINENQLDYTIVTYNSYSDILIHCNNCGCDWHTSGTNLCSGHRCTSCRGSHMELITKEILKKHNIDFISEYSFDDCVDINKLRFDFYLNNLNIAIELDGEQHFRPVCFGGISEEELLVSFYTTQRHDKIKNEYCKEKNIELIRIPYWELSNIEKYILNLL